MIKDEDAITEAAWYALQVVIGSEQQVEDAIRARAISMHQEENILDVLVPVHKVTKVYKNKEAAIVDEVFQPGYVYVKMKYTPECWFVVRNTNKVLGILGSSGGGKAPVPVWDSEIENLKRQMNILPDKPVEKIDFKGHIGDTVKIISLGQNGVIESIDGEKQTVNVSYELLGRTISNDFDMNDIELLN